MRASTTKPSTLRRRAAAHADEPMLDINTTPLIDVMLVLLIMLIITIPVQLDSVHMHLPTGAPPPRQDRSAEVLRIEVDADSTVRWNGEALADSIALDRRMQLTARQSDPPEIHLRPDRRAGYAVVANVLSTAQRAGLVRVSIVGSEQFAP
ncbi:biopolymer transporter ExbD [Acidovorax sp. NCPPB 2350]|nr:biopolymer transporter ExbD [Acidovorax sp. NCPPB 2350]